MLQGLVLVHYYWTNYYMTLFVSLSQCLSVVGAPPSSDSQPEPMSTDPPQTAGHTTQNMMGTSPVS